MKKLFAVLFALHLMILPIPAQAMTKQLTGIAIGAVGVSAAASCALKSPSLLMYIAGAAVYLMGELQGGKEQKQQLDDSKNELERIKANGNKGGEIQLESLKAQLKDKEEKRRLAKKRSGWAGAASMMFTAAAAMAVTEIPMEFLGTLPPLGCQSGTAMAMGTVKATAVVAGYSFLAGGGLNGALMGAVAGFVVAQSAVINVMNTAVGRVAGMTVVAGLTMMAKKETDGEIKKLDKDIKDLEEVIAQFKIETDGKGPNTEDTTVGAQGGINGDLAGTTSGSNGGSAGGVNAGGGTGLTMLPTATASNTSVTCINSNQEFSSNCSNPLKLSSPNLKMFGNQPELQQVVNQGVGMANDAVSGNMGKADLAAASLNASAGRMNDLLKKNLASANAKLKSQGKKPIDLEKAQQDVLNSMQSAFDKKMAGQEQSLAALGIGKMSLDPNAQDNSGQNITAASSAETIAVPTSDAKAQDAVAANADLAAASIPPEDLKAQESAASALGNNLADYETNTGDISGNKEDSLWKQVSNRYLLNYGKLFERNKVPAQ